jgi:transcriptional regulator with XRE-family HTH domain
MIDVGKMISSIRKERGLSQLQLAEKLSISKQAISNYERGIREPDYVTLEAIADVLNVPIAMLISREDQEKALGKLYNDPTQAREELADDPERKALLNLARYGSAQDVRAVASLIDALRATNPDFYDGDDPA